MPFGIIGRTDQGEAGSGVWGSVHGKGYFWGGANLGRAIVTNGTLRRTCATTLPTPGSSNFGPVKLALSLHEIKGNGWTGSLETLGLMPEVPVGSVKP